MPSNPQPKGLAVNEIRKRVAQFAFDYRDASRERAESQTFWGAFLRCFGIDTPHQHGITFEYPARRASAGRGAIDVFQPAIKLGAHPRDGFLIEQKSEGRIAPHKGTGRSNAEEQAFDYLDGGDIPDYQRPRWVITSDFSTIQITDLSKPARAVGRTKTFATRDLPHYVEDFLWLTGADTRSLLAEEQTEASIAAARIMGDLYAAMTGDADTDEAVDASEEPERVHAISVLLTRLLFLMFGDDADLWNRDLFKTFIETRTSPDGSDLGGQLHVLFENLNKPEDKRDPRLDEAIAAFPYINGDLFAQREPTQSFDNTMRTALLAACDFDWSRISPAVFGSLFQTVKSKEARHGDGEHYTSEENILKTIGPLFLDEFRERINKATSVPQLEAIHAEMRDLRFVDPACGCGNFLVVAYRELRALELDLLMKMRERAGQENLLLNPADLLHITLDQFTGIELNWWPAKIAQTAMFLVDHQCNRQMQYALGLAPNRLPITIAATIHHANALRADWNQLLPGLEVTTYVFGNPPFLGRRDTSDEQKADLQAAWGGKPTAHLDLVTAWYNKALGYFDEKQGEFAFVSSNSISQGEQPADLFPEVASAGWRIKFAHRTFEWKSESASKDKAAVHCVIIGFTRDTALKQRLFTYATVKSEPTEVKPVTGINAYLSDAPNVYVHSRSKPLSGDLAAVNFGSMPRDGGNLLIEPDDYATVMADPIAAKYVRRFIGAEQLIRNEPRWCLWMTDLEPSDVPKSPVLRARLGGVRDMRSKSKASTTREWAKLPHLFVQQAQPSVPYICIPRHFSETRLYATVERFDPDVIAGDSCFTTVDPDGFIFALLSSSMFITWQKTVGGRLKSDPRFSKEIVWNSLPLPPVTPAERTAIIKAGEGVTAARNLHPERSLADHYQPLSMTRELVDAHRVLDRLVDKAFGAGRGDIDDVKRQAILIARYAEFTGEAN